MTQLYDTFDPATLDWSESGTLSGWTYDKAVTKRWNGDFLHLYRVKRTCKSCGCEISLDVTKRALQGVAKNAGLLMKNCKACRDARKNGGPGSRGGTSRPTADPATSPIVTDELEALRTANATMKLELDGLYATVHDLQTRLAKYELPEAMRQATNQPKEGFPWL